MNSRLSSIAVIAIPTPARIRMAVAPVPVIALLTAIQPSIFAVRFARVCLAPINAVGAILVAVPAMIIAMVGIVVAHRTACGANRRDKSESQNERSHIMLYCFHVDIHSAPDVRGRHPRFVYEMAPINRGMAGG